MVIKGRKIKTKILAKEDNLLEALEISKNRN